MATWPDALWPNPSKSEPVNVKVGLESAIDIQMNHDLSDLISP